MKQRKRLLSVLLVFAMVISLCSSMGTVVAKAAEGGVTLVSRTDFVSKLEEMNVEFSVDAFTGNTTIKSFTFEYTAPDADYTISEVNFAENETEVIHSAYKMAADGSGYDVYFWTDNETQIMAPESCTFLFARYKSVCEIDFANFDTSNVTDMWSMFQDSSNLVELDVTDFDTSNVTKMTYMFSGCNSLIELDLTGFDTSSVTDMQYMFSSCNSLIELDLTGFNTSCVTDMDNMFLCCTSLVKLDISNFDTSNVTSMYRMFEQCGNLVELDLSSFDTSNVTNMSRMFYWCNSLEKLDVTNFNTSKVTDMSDMFWMDWYSNATGSLKELDLSSFDTSSVTDMNGMFYNCTNLEELDLSNFDTSKVTDMSDMFQLCNNLKTLDLSSFNTSNVTDMSGMFYDCSSLTELDVTGFNTSNVTDMSSMFSGCSSLTELDVTGFDTSNVTDMNWIFNGLDSLTELDLSNLIIRPDYEVGGAGFTLTDGNIPILYTPKSYPLTTEARIGDYYAYIDENGTTVYVDGLDNTITESLKLHRKYFIYYMTADGVWLRGLEPSYYLYGYGCTLPDQYEWVDADGNVVTEISQDTYGEMRLTQYEKGAKLVSSSKFISKMLEMNPEFSGLGSRSEGNTTIKSITFAYTAPSDGYTISDINFSTSQSKVIHGAYKKTEDGSGYDVCFWTENAEQIMAPEDCSLFLGCEGVRVIDLSNFDTSEVTSMFTMFMNCKSLENIDLSKFDTSKVTSMYGMFYGCSSLTELDVTNLNTSNVTDMRRMFYGCSSLTELDVTGFDTSNVINMDLMFGDLNSLHTLDLSNFIIKPDYQVEDGFQLLDGTVRILYTPKSYPLDTPVTIGSYAYVDENGTIVDMFTLNNTLIESMKLSRKYSIRYQDAEGNRLSDLKPSTYVYGYGCTVSDKYEWLDADGNIVTEITPDFYGTVVLTQKASESTPTPSPSPEPENPTPSPEPTPEVTPTPETPSTTPTVTPETTPTPETPSTTPTPTPATGPSITVTPTPTPSPNPTPEMPSPTPTPAHTHSLQCIPAVSATCTTAGNQAYYVCTVTDCGKVFTDEAAQKETTLQAVVIPALGHNFTTATCLTPSTCVTCGITQGSARGHNYSGATCTQDSVCYDCGAYGESAYGHSFGKATCTEPSTCAYCGTTQGSALGHLLEEDWSCDEERHWKNCTRSGCVVDAGKHTAGDWIVTEEDGYEVHRKFCTICEKELVKIDMGAVFHQKFDTADKKDKQYEGSVSVPVTGNGEVQATVDVKDKVASVNDFSLDAWKESTKEDEEEKVLAFDFSGLDAYIEAVSLSRDLMKNVLDEVKDEKSQTKGMTIGLTTGMVELDEEALQAVVAQARGKNIHLHVDNVGTDRLNEAQNKAIENVDVHGGIEAYFTSSNQRIGDFKGGKVTIKIPFSIPKKLEASGFSIWYVDKNGKTTKYECTYEDGYLVFTVDHFSDFLIVYDAEDVIDEEELARATEAENFAVAFAPLRLKVSKVSKTTQELEWRVCDEADGYVIYGSKNSVNTDDKMLSGSVDNGNIDELIPLTVIRDKDTTTWTRYDLAEGTYYTYVIKAYKLVNDDMQFVTQSKTVYAVTNGGEYVNTKIIRLNTKNFIMQKGSSFELVAEEVIFDGKQKKFANLYFVSTDENVASIDQNAMITAKKAGVCQIYVMAQNGVTTRLCVVVEK